MARNRKGGRPKLTEAQKLAKLLERAKPNPRVAARQDRFRHFLGDGAIGLEMTCAGRLMIVGAFDGLEASPEECLNALLAYSHGYWGYYHGGPQMSDYEREVRGGNADAPIDPRTGLPLDPRGEWFDSRDAALRDCGLQVVRAVHSITVDRHWFPDEDSEWAERIINTRVLRKREVLRAAKKPCPPTLTICGELATDSDEAMLDLARFGALELARGQVLRRAA